MAPRKGVFQTQYQSSYAKTTTSDHIIILDREKEKKKETIQRIPANSNVPEKLPWKAPSSGLLEVTAGFLVCFIFLQGV